MLTLEDECCGIRARSVLFKMIFPVGDQSLSSEQIMWEQSNYFTPQTCFVPRIFGLEKQH